MQVKYICYKYIFIVMFLIGLLHPQLKECSYLSQILDKFDILVRFTLHLKSS